MFRNRQIVKYPPLHVLRLTLRPLPIPTIQHSTFPMPLHEIRLTFHVLRFTGIEEFSPDALLTRHIAIDVPEACAAGFEKFIVIASQSPGFHGVKGKHEGTGDDRQYLS
jgi:hypothetical protein